MTKKTKFFEVYKRSISHLQLFWKPIICGAIFFGVALGCVQQYAHQVTVARMSESLTTLGFDPVQLDNLQKRMRDGDEMAMEEFVQEVQKAQLRLQLMPSAQRVAYLQEKAIEAFLNFVPIMIAILLVTSFITYISMYYYLLQSANKADHFVDVVGLFFRNFLPLLGLSSLVFLKTFVWIPTVGILLGLIFAPRYAFAGVIFVREKCGVFESAKRSYQRSKGLWWPIVKNTYFSFLVTFVCIGVVTFVNTITVGSVSPITARVISGVLTQVGVALTIIFVVELSIELMSKQKIATK